MGSDAKALRVEVPARGYRELGTSRWQTLTPADVPPESAGHFRVLPGTHTARFDDLFGWQRGRHTPIPTGELTLRLR